MTKKDNRELILNMVNFYSLFNVEFIDLIPDLTNTEITPLLSKILNFIHFEGTTTASRISKKLNISVPNTSRSINALYNLGYLIKKQDEKDKRIVYLSLSNKSLNLISSVAATGEDIFLERFNVLSNEEIAELSQSLLKAQNLIIKMRDLYEDKKTMK
ncbi:MULTISPECIES: MarR family winged helix-turn-helix transcriptional regulator [Clostridium]|jgi:DNA-binding MarR family transcriptional regulator|uniref:MarR family transcriptional regulator n=2 Tax=Clostridium beijerinckii TaxID=1520 RepID=A0AAE2RTX4_CLOBE|nr:MULTISPECIES: winged helix DNA-binding protein [Clostridium]ABR34986.1 transcriptional regulator, MarR family [Clostridium beijerinckii NCIMB 8052]AIU03628.1 MarR family transcriptional regulator [Clostridium beijerinckii ATCC 35702]MBF7810376.1 MarR family transcriptional regulator [Clostridium beijerinckii]MBN7575653.1 MarR family transcriptional regulator [Clostridium beijerinckii]MBN7580578.1 MarR family transcriptional regulator [Clostridium beijerinckii]